LTGLLILVKGLPLAYNRDLQEERVHLYTAVDSVFEEQIRGAIGSAGAGWRVWSGVGAYQNTFDGAVQKVEISRRLGAGGVILFSYDWLVSEGSAPGGGAYLPAFGDRVFSGR
jgi:hypothetical protein